jgi:hypothetical protein
MAAPERPLTARDVILEIVHNMREGIEQLLYSSVAPGVYHVFLHADDYERLAPIAARVVDEARRALDEELDRMNGGDRLTPGPLRRWLRRPPPVERPGAEWIVQLQPDPDGELAPGHIAVTSELTLPPRPQLDGTETRRVTTVQRGGGAPGQTSRQTVVAPATVSTRSPHATITYTDDEGPQAYAVEQDRIVIGRGGLGYWVDLKLRSAPDVSREHLRIRRDPASGRFFVKDLSTYGTTLDGVAIPRSIEIVEGQKRDLEIEVPLPDRARLELAGMVVLQFVRQGGQGGSR